LDAASLDTPPTDSLNGHYNLTGTFPCFPRGYSSTSLTIRRVAPYFWSFASSTAFPLFLPSFCFLITNGLTTRCQGLVLVSPPSSLREFGCFDLSLARFDYAPPATLSVSYGRTFFRPMDVFPFLPLPTFLATQNIFLRSPDKPSPIFTAQAVARVTTPPHVFLHVRTLGTLLFLSAAQDVLCS